ncbi:MAG TPA: dihydrolipoyllysine-residue acetyltransferase [Casimicrobiaceae bacterium]|nr:dihydrolipoyllysine-residue acetyltransferase [Casimicrobiaceae bacterium]
MTTREPAAPRAGKASVSPPPASAQSPAGIAEVRVPDIGGFRDVPVIEIMVKPGDVVEAEDSLVTLESDKATMDVPSPLGGTVRELRVAVGDRVCEGTTIATLTTEVDAMQAPASPAAPQAQRPEFAAPPKTPEARHTRSTAAPASDAAPIALPYASPAVRRRARELDVDLVHVSGSGRNGRIVREDVEAFAKGVVHAAVPPRDARSDQSVHAARTSVDVLPWPKVDFAKFGPIEAKPLSRIRRLSGANLARNWVTIPHVTNHDDADVTELEAFRIELNGEIAKSGVRVSMLAFLIKAACATLAAFPEFNASLDGDELILKRYYHIGFAADTPDGLVVPVIRDADRKGIVDIAKEAGELATLARNGKLGADRMQGGTFTISSLGGIGGTYFTPIINAPEVAIVGVCRAAWKQISVDGTSAAWRLMLPLSLSYDHRVIDGAAAARFNRHFAQLLAEMRRVLL